jgi:hypothetical protein
MLLYKESSQFTYDEDAACPVIWTLLPVWYWVPKFHWITKFCHVRVVSCASVFVMRVIFYCTSGLVYKLVLPSTLNFFLSLSLSLSLCGTTALTGASRRYFWVLVKWCKVMEQSSFNILWRRSNFIIRHSQWHSDLCKQHYEYWGISVWKNPTKSRPCLWISKSLFTFKILNVICTWNYKCEVT